MKDALQSRSTGRMEWRCSACTTVLASMELDGLHLDQRLTRLDGEKAGLTRYGAGTGGTLRAQPRRLPIYVYCPACRAGQRIGS